MPLTWPGLALGAPLWGRGRPVATWADLGSLLMGTPHAWPRAELPGTEGWSPGPFPPLPPALPVGQLHAGKAVWPGSR